MALASPATVTLCIATDVAHILLNGVAWSRTETEQSARDYLAHHVERWPDGYRHTETVTPAASATRPEIFRKLVYYHRRPWPGSEEQDHGTDR